MTGQARARRRVRVLAVPLTVAAVLLGAASLAGLLGAVVARPSALGWVVTGFGVTSWLAAVVWRGLYSVRRTPVGSSLPADAAAVIRARFRRLGSWLLGTAAVCAVAEAVALAVLLARGGSSSDAAVVATSLLGAGLLALLGRGSHRTWP